MGERLEGASPCNAFVPPRKGIFARLPISYAPSLQDYKDV